MEETYDDKIDLIEELNDNYNEAISYSSEIRCLISNPDWIPGKYVDKIISKIEKVEGLLDEVKELIDGLRDDVEEEYEDEE